MTWGVDILAFIPFLIILSIISVRAKHKHKKLETQETNAPECNQKKANNLDENDGSNENSPDEDTNKSKRKGSRGGTLRGVLVLIFLQIFIIVIGLIFPTHSWAAASCTTPKTCTICQMTEGDALGHECEDATCTEPKRCTRCGETFGYSLGHDMEKATCTEGSVCKRCGKEVPATGHKWKDATCTEPKTCTVCVAIEGDALGHTTTNGTCSRCGKAIFETVNGSGDDVIEGLQLSTGMYRVHVTNSGSSNFAVWADGNKSSRDLKINDIGSYDGYIFLAGGDTYKLEIKSSGSWSYIVEQLQSTTNTSFSGPGDYVTEKISCSSGTWHFSHDGSSNFVVRAYTTNGGDLLVNTIGAYDGKKSVTVPAGSYILFEINADGNWSAEKQ